MAQYLPKEFRKNGEIYRPVPIENSDDIGIERKSETGWTSIGKFNSSGSFTKTNDTSEDEEKNSSTLVTEARKALAEPVTTEEIQINYRGVDKTKGSYTEIKKYPSDMLPTQDRIEFSVWEYADRSIQNDASQVVAFGNAKRGEDQGYRRVSSAGFVYLPVTKISDNNSVDWQEDRLNEIQRQLANLSLGAMTPGANKASVEEATSGYDVYKNFLTGNPAGNLARLYLAGQAVQVNNLLTRATGAVLNPNLELLFNGPQLRQFSFSFDLFSKGPTDAKMIKDIIYFFKAYMAVRDNVGNRAQAGPSVDNQQSTSNPETSSEGVFLNTPYIFKIRYIKGKEANVINGDTSEIHQSIGKIKRCALQSCTVDYTPLGTYMTFSDGTMVMYRITLQFKELTPIYASDYEGTHPIGY